MVIAWMESHDNVLPKEYYKPTEEQKPEYALALRFRKLKRKLTLKPCAEVSQLVKEIEQIFTTSHL